MADIKKMAKIWDFKDKIYHDYELPEKARYHCCDMNEKVQCASCGKEIRFGNGYTSLRIHTPIGYGYAVCHVCYRKENELGLGIERGNDYE